MISTDNKQALADCTRGLILTIAVAVLSVNTTSAQQQSSKTASSTNSTAKANLAHKSHQESAGERVFAENCSRCHTAPDGFSPHITGTVVRHMRVRASLSEQDEQALLRFFNPQ